MPDTDTGQTNMTFSQSVETCFSKYATFSGRASRSEYWWFSLALFIFYFLAGLIDYALRTDVASIIVLVALFLPSYAVAVRRMHDTNHSGWWVLVPIVNLIFALISGDEGWNDYGSKPE